MKNYLIKIFLIAFCLVFSKLSFAISWNMATPYPDVTFHTKNIHNFVTDVKNLTNNKIKIKVHSAASLFKHPEIARAVRSNQVQTGEFFLSLLNNDNNIFGVDSIPFLVTNYEEARKLWDIQKFYVEKLLAKQNMKVLYAVPWPPQGLYTKKKINDIKDLSKLKFRSYNSSLAKFASLVGAVATQIEVPDIPQAFSTGRVEAMITSPSTGVNSKAWDYLSHYTDIQAWIPKNIVVINRKTFGKLSANQQKKIIQAAKRAEKRGWEMSIKETSEKTLQLKNKGIKVAIPSDKLKLQLESIGKKMIEDWKKNASEDGKKMLEKYLKR